MRNRIQLLFLYKGEVGSLSPFLKTGEYHTVHWKTEGKYFEIGSWLDFIRRELYDVLFAT